MTTRLYYTDAYLADFSATVAELSADGTRVYLDATAFYPTSGGQPFDVGTLGGAKVVDVVDEDSRIAHLLASPATFGPGAQVSARVDWARRHDHMQQHTGQHLLSAMFEDLLGAKTVSVHFGAGDSTLDLDVESLSREQLLAVEARANAVVAEARPVTVTFEDAATAVGLRKPSERGGELRIVGIEGIDRSACGGTHVRATAEIGAILLRSTEKVRKTTRVAFVCGDRAVRLAHADYETLNAIASALSCAPSDVPTVVATQGERLRDADNSRRKLEKELAAYRARERHASAAPLANGVHLITVRDAADVEELRTFAQAALALPKTAVIGVLQSPPSVLFAASEDSGVDAGKILKAALAAAGGRGGGSPRIAQGSVPSADALEPLLSALVSAAGG